MSAPFESQASYASTPASSLSPIIGARSPDEFYLEGQHGSESYILNPLPLHSAADIEARLVPKPNKTDDTPHHIFSKRQKLNLVFLVSLAGSFSPLSSNIYFPAVDSISQELNVSLSLVGLTITVYMIVQGIAPSFFGAISDTCGRRLAFMATLTIYTAANLALAFTTSYPMLLVLRGVQAMGSAATISISAGVIGDIAAPGERGGFMGTNAGIRMMGQAIGPVIGGVLNSIWGFRSIFWLLFTMSVLVLLTLVIFLPETQRTIAGNGSTPLTGFHKPLVYVFWPPKEWANASREPRPKSPPLSFEKVITPLTYVFEKDILTLLSWGALVYTIWSMVTSSTATSLLHSFPNLTQWQVGLCFLPNGLGCIAGSLVAGQLLDKSFKRVEAEFKEERGLETVNVKNTEDFPFERARLPLMPYFSAAFLVSMALYFGANLMAPLLLQFMVAFTATAVFNINSTMMVDCFPDSSAGATATNNLCRCLLGAAGVSAIQPIIQAVKVRSAFLILTGVVTLFSPLVWVQWKYGEKWRLERRRRTAKSAP